MNNSFVYSIVGPTASGKTALSIELAKRTNGEIINGDAMQVYRELSIGTAKIKPHEMQGIQHHLFDCLDPSDSFSVADYQKLVRDQIQTLVQQEKQPIVVGGSGLYIQSVLFNYQFTEEKVDEALRETLYNELEKNGSSFMHEKLQQVDPETAKTIHPNNTRRVIRAIEIAHSKQGLKSDAAHQQGNEVVIPHVIIGMDLPRDLLYERINQRVDQMVEEGLVEEVRTLFDKGLQHAQSMKAIGYKEIVAAFDGKMSLEDAIELVKQNSRKYAKRQMTYFRNKLHVHWIDALQPKEKLAEEILKRKEEFLEF